MPVSPGTYDIDIKCVSYGSDQRVAVLRGRLQHSTHDSFREAGEFTVDAASAGVIDADALDLWGAADEAACERWQERFTESGSPDIAGFFPCQPIGSAMVVVSSGFGDGCYKAFTLLQGEKPVGFEARFLDDDQEYFEGSGSRRPGVKDYALAILAVPFAIVAIAVGAVSLGIARVLTKVSNLFSRPR